MSGSANQMMERPLANMFLRSSNVLPLTCAAFARQNTKTGELRRSPSATGRVRFSGQVRCDVPGRCSLKRVVHPGDFRQSESSSNEQVDRKVPDERTQECAKLPPESRTAGQTSLRTRLVGARGVGGRRYE